jgi:hypothetical protein
MATYSQKAPFNDWWYWSECLVKRFRTCAEIYRENDDSIRATDLDATATYLKNLFLEPARGISMPPKDDKGKYEQKQKEENAILDAANKFREILIAFPMLSSAVQSLSGVKWDSCAWEGMEIKTHGWHTVDTESDTNKGKKSGKTGGSAGTEGGPKVDKRMQELFWGTQARPDEGIRSGKVEDGGLPGIIYNLLVAEKAASNRTPTEYRTEGLKNAMGKWDKAGMKSSLTPFKS